MNNVENISKITEHQSRIIRFQERIVERLQCNGIIWWKMVEEYDQAQRLQKMVKFIFNVYFSLQRDCLYKH